MIEVRVFCGKEINTPTGVCVNSLQALRDVAERYFNKVTYCTSSQINPHEWSKKSILIFPGGKCSEWDQIITEEHRRSLHNYVKEGGAILGICAGACYWVKTVNYLSNLTYRNYPLSSRSCEGPLSDEMEVEEILWLRTKERINVLVNKGVQFLPSDKQEQDEVLALYLRTSKPAVIFSRPGQGRLILSGPHLEHSAEDLDLVKKGFPDLDEKIKSLQEKLKLTNHLRLMFLNHCFLLLIESKM